MQKLECSHVHEPLMNQKSGLRISESIIQQIWTKTTFPLKCKFHDTYDGKRIDIINAGMINESDGPDILNACIQKNDIRFYGSIEIHINESDWFAHQHHLDGNYQSVVAHVFLNNQNKQAKTRSSSIPIHIELDPHLANPKTWIDQLQKMHHPPCMPLAAKVSAEKWAHQLEVAAKVYYQKLVARFITDSPCIEQWKSHLITSIWEQMGVPHNREQMKALCIEWQTGDYELDAMKINSKGIRPAGRLEQRFHQAVAYCSTIIDVAPEEIKRNAKLIRDKCFESARKKGLGISMHHRLLKMVWIPALEACLFSNQSTEQYFAEWIRIPTPLPSAIRNYFRDIELLKHNSFQAHQHASLVAQKRYFCDFLRCEACGITK